MAVSADFAAAGSAASPAYGKHAADAPVLAVLGPTNTGKTHFAVERMLGHASGVIGLPLRLLAREIYDRVVAEKGALSVALVTGEERIVPPRPRWFVCTVESMPLERPFDFLAIDEIQLCGDDERGHVFTDRLLRARGREETMFLGADTMSGLIRRLAPAAKIVRRDRLSRLTYAGPKKLSRLPPRTAIVAFTANEVYAIAEFVRRQRGGAAVVLGALSPRTRNAQVAMYQAGEVDFLIATDAIGMGLNLAVNHVALAGLRKFDGRGVRPLTAGEIGQVAGRAGRHMSNGTFGTTGDAGPLDAGLVERLENHRFDAVTHARWRNSALDFTTVRDLLRALDMPAPAAALTRARDADDYIALKALSRDPAISRVADRPAAIRLLWEVCQIPDYRKTMPEAHVRLLGQIFGYLAAGPQRLPHDWVARHLAQLDRVEGDIDTLASRIAHVRTWTYVSHRTEWIDDAAHWRERARAIEDRLSDAMHERLMQRFVDRRAAVLTRRLKDPGEIATEIDADGSMLVEGEAVGRLVGLSFRPLLAAGQDDRALRAAASRALRPALETRAARLLADKADCFDIADDGQVVWRGEAVARLAAGDGALAPRLKLIGGDQLPPPLRRAVQQRLQDWVRGHIRDRLGPLVAVGEAEFSGPARGLAFQLAEALGTLLRRRVMAQVAAIAPGDRARLEALGVTFGAAGLYMPALLGPAATRLKAALWAAAGGGTPPVLAQPEESPVPEAAAIPEQAWHVLGYVVVGGQAVRVDKLERFAAAARAWARKGEFTVRPRWAAVIGCRPEHLGRIVRGLGYRSRDGRHFTPLPKARRRRGGKSDGDMTVAIAKLKQWVEA
jgi:ATP-dependent RNA helicase SUPV3L1/SUV3